jgi:hypothetical protein
VFSRVRNPNLKLDSEAAKNQAYLRFMPQLSGDAGGAVEGDPRTFLRLSVAQYAVLEQWAAGDFDADWEPGKVTAPGGVASFCTQPNDGHPPPIGQCNQLNAVAGNGYFSVKITPGTLQSGLNTLNAFVYDRWGQVSSATVRVRIPTDIRITGMEVTQGIQTPALPLNTGAPTSYQGVTLIADGKTIVRVFANQVSGAPTRGVQAQLFLELPQPS